MWLQIVIILFVLKNRIASSCVEKVDGDSGIITHPSYPNNYQPNVNCRWSTSAREKDKIQIVFVLLDIEADQSGRCGYDFVSILYPDKPNEDRFCGLIANREPGKTLLSNGTGDPMIRFTSDDSVQAQGFKIRFTIERYPYCDDEPCQNDATCEETEEEEQGFRCDCTDGWTGDICDEDLDECEENPCENGGTCSTPEFNMYQCDCADGFEGENCEIDSDECESNPCQHEGTCEDEENSYQCYCASGYEGDNCEKETNECESTPCQHGGTCYDQVNGYVCRCAPGYAGNDCVIDIDECESNPCQNDGSCHDLANSYVCECSTGYEGRDCEHETNECDSNPCQNNARCIDKLDSYECVCGLGYEGTHCEVDFNECRSLPCQNNGKCFEPDPGMFACVCPAGFSGILCETDPCYYGECVDLPGTFLCVCEVGFTGRKCGTDIDECLNFPCHNNATCRNKYGEFYCDCEKNFTGIYCEIAPDINECKSNPCQHSGMCTDRVSGFFCQCIEGYGGSMCEIELDECDSGPCENGGHCVDQPSLYQCVCQEGFTGTNCELDESSPCISNPCQNDGECNDYNEGFICECTEGFTGDVCDQDQDHCHPYRCLHSGKCHHKDDVTTCECRDGFTGEYCETDINDCAELPCLNGGSCLDRENEFLCLCREGYSGPTCADDSGLQWRSEAQMLGALLPSLLFLLLIGIAAASFLLFVRKKRNRLTPMHSLVEVKPAENACSFKSPKMPKKVSFNSHSRKKRRVDKETVIDYDYNDPDKFPPYINDIPMPEFHYSEPHYREVYPPSPINTQKGMFYQTGNMAPGMSPTKQYPNSNTKAFCSPMYNHHPISDAYEFINSKPYYFNKRDERSKHKKHHKIEEESFSDKNLAKDEITECSDSIIDRSMTLTPEKKHWQDRDTDKLKSVPQKHIYIHPEVNSNNSQDEDAYEEPRGNLVHNKQNGNKRKHRLSVQFAQPETPDYEQVKKEPFHSLQRQKTTIYGRESVRKNIQKKSKIDDTSRKSIADNVYPLRTSRKTSHPRSNTSYRHSHY